MNTRDDAYDQNDELYYQEFGTEAGYRRRAAERARVHGELARANALIAQAIGLLEQAKAIADAENYEGTMGYIGEAIGAAAVPNGMITEELTTPLRLSFGDRWFDEHLWPEWQLAVLARAGGESGRRAAEIAHHERYHGARARD